MQREYSVMNFLARRRASKKPSATNMISQISSKSGTTIAQGLFMERPHCRNSPEVLYLKGNRELPEKGLEILWKLSSASITRVHGDEDADCWVQLDFLSQEVEDVLLVPDGILDTLHLHRHH